MFSLAIYRNMSRVYVAWVVHPSNLYTATGSQAMRWQKLGGVGAFSHHNNSVRLVYRDVGGGTVEYATYTYKDGRRSFEVLGTAQVGEAVRVVLYLPKLLPWAVRLFPYFETTQGNAPHNMTFDVDIRRA